MTSSRTNVFAAWAAMIILAVTAGIVAFCVNAPKAEAAHPGNPGRLVWASNRAGGDMEIYTSATDGSSITRITNNSVYEGDPSWGPGGKAIAFSTNRDGNKEIYTVKPDGSGLTRLTRNAAIDMEPTWSKDGTQVAFSRQPAGEDSEIFVVNVLEPEGTDGAVDNVVQLTNNTVDDHHPSFSPIDDTLAYDQYDPVRDARQIVTQPIVDGAGGAETVIAPAGNAAEWDPDWAPDASKIVYTRGYDIDSGVYRMNPDGTGRVVVSDVAGAFDNTPAHYPNGEKIVFRSDRGGNLDVYNANTDGTNVVNITNSDRTDTHPEVSASTETQTVITSVESMPSAEGQSNGWVKIEFQTAPSYQPAASFECRVDGGAWNACTSPHTFSGLPNTQTQTIEIRGLNSAGIAEPTAAVHVNDIIVAPDDGGDSGSSLGLLFTNILMLLDRYLASGQPDNSAQHDGHIGSIQPPPCNAPFSGCGIQPRSSLSLWSAYSGRDTRLGICNRGAHPTEASIGRRRHGKYFVYDPSNDGNCNFKKVPNLYSHWADGYLRSGRSYHPG